MAQYDLAGGRVVDRESGLDAVRNVGVRGDRIAAVKTTLILPRIMEAALPQMKKKGRLQVGCDADIVVFDLEKIQDNATFAAPARLSSGQRHVVVNGVPIIEEGVRNGDARPGRALRREG